MTQVNLLESGPELLNLIHLLETHQAETILFSREGMPVAELRLSEKPTERRKPGIAKGKIHIPDEYFGAMDRELESAFGDAL